MMPFIFPGNKKQIGDFLVALLLGGLQATKAQHPINYPINNCATYLDSVLMCPFHGKLMLPWERAENNECLPESFSIGGLE